MSRSITETLERGFRNTVANWPLLLLKVAGTIVGTMVFVVAAIASIVPVAVSLGLSGLRATTPEDVAEALLSVVTNHWPALLIVVAVLTLALTVVIAIFSFVEAGIARVLIDGDRRASGLAPDRRAFEAFSIERWLEGGKSHWVTLFWIYNIAWAVASGVILVPLVLTVIAMMLSGGAEAGMIVAGCAGLAVTALLALLVAFMTNVWVRKAIVVAVARDCGASEALGLAMREAMGDFTRHFAVAFILMAISIGVSGLSSVFSMVGSFDNSGVASLAMMPVQLGLSVVTGVISAAISMWVIASFASLTVEGQ